MINSIAASYLNEQFQAARQAGWQIQYTYPPEEIGVEIYATHGSHAEQHFSTKNTAAVESPEAFAAWVQRCANALLVLTPNWLGPTSLDGISGEADL